MQDTDSGLWGVYNTSGEQLMPYQYADLSYVAYDCFLTGAVEPLKSIKKSTVLSDEYINSHGFALLDGTLIIDNRYGTVKVYNRYWASCWVVDPASEDDYDYKFDANHFFKIRYADIVYLGDWNEPGSARTDRPYYCGRFTREQFKSAQAHGQYLSVSDREGKVTVYDRKFNVLDIRPEKVGSSIYKVKKGSVCDPEGNVIMEGVSSVKEAATADGLQLICTIKDSEGNKRYGIYRLDGTEVLAPQKLEIVSATAHYAVVKKNEKQGLYSLDEKRLIVPCLYDKMVANNTGMDNYLRNGFVIVEYGGLQFFYNTAPDADNSNLVRLETEKRSYKLLGSSYSYREEARTVVVNADGQRYVIRHKMTSGFRGDGYLIPYKLDAHFGVMTWHTKDVLTEYANAINLTDDNCIICNSTRHGYQLYALDTP